jgi:hypothetical protein
MAKTFQSHAVQFNYPDNWTVESPEDSTGPLQVTVFSPQTAYWQLSLHPADAALEPLFDEALAALRAEYREIEVEPAQAVLEGRQVEGFNAQFYCLDLTVTAWLRGVRTDQGLFFLVCQAEDREIPLHGQVFLAMLASLLRSSGPA